MFSRKRLTIFFIVVLMTAVGFSAFAQAVATDLIGVTITVDAIALIKVSGSDLTFAVESPGAAAAGELPVVNDSNTPTYIQYTSVVASGARKIDVKASAALPAGLKLNIRAGTPTGHGGVGTPVAGGVMVDSTGPTTDQTIITGISSCATGSGGTQGPAIYYTLSIDEATFGSLTTAGASGITLTYTLTANS